MKTFYCKDCGMECSFLVTGTDERAVSHKVIEHMHADHGMEAIPAETMMKIYSAIRKKQEAGTIPPKVIAEPLVA
jgi:predicted small metal-binding protein